MSIQVETPQNVTIDYEPAGLGFRALAYIVDLLVKGAWALLCFYITFRMLKLDETDFFDDYFSLYTYIIVLAVPIIFYDLLFEYFTRGQSPGKKIFKIRVVNINGSMPSFGSYLMRWLFRLVDIDLFYAMPGIISILSTKNSQRIGDILAGTTVISLMIDKKNKLEIPNLEYNDNYKVVYYDVLDKLSDRDIQMIRSILDDNKMKDNEYFTTKLVDRIKTITGYSFDGDNHSFLVKLLDDYNYLALQQ